MPIVLAGMFTIPRKFHNLFLIVISLSFYTYAEQSLTLVILSSILINYLSGLFISDNQGKNTGKVILLCGIIANLSLLIYFKYYSFFISIISDRIISETYLLLGVSFFTFQGISYLVDVYNRKIQSEKNPISFSLYILLFPQLVAGPIIRYEQIRQSIKKRDINLEQTSKGMRRFTIGLAKKVIIADNLAIIADAAFNLPASELYYSAAWLAIVCYSIQIFMDFSGYTDMAIGLGLIIGFKFPENFNYPYLANSIQDFWRRWHITLSEWFRDYLYIPLGGNRSGFLFYSINVITVFSLTGLWHGANYTYITWGLLFGCLLILENRIRKYFNVKIPILVSRTLCFFLVTLLWVLFRSPNLNYASEFYSSLFRLSNGHDSLPWYYLNGYRIALLSLGILLSFGRSIVSALRKQFAVEPAIQNCLILLLFLYCCLEIINTSHSPFIYFRF